MRRSVEYLDIIIILGYGLYRSVSMSCYLTAMHITEQPFVFVSDMAFNLAANLVTMVAAVCVMALAYRRHAQGLNMPVIASVLLWSLFLALASMGLLDFLSLPVRLLVLALVYGAGSTMITLAYVQVMSYQAPSKVMGYIAFSALLNIPLTWLLLTIGTAPGVILSVAFMALSVACLRLAQRAVDNTVSDGTGFVAFMLRTPALPPPEGPAGKNAWRLTRAPLRKRYRKAFLAIGDALIAACVLEAVVGLLNTFMLGGEHFFNDSEWVTSISLAIASVIFAVFALVPLRAPNTATVFKGLFVVLPVLLMLLPFLDTQFGRAVNIVLLVGYDSILFIATYTVITTAHNSGLSSHLLMGAFMSMMRFCLLGSLLLGYWFGADSLGQDNTRYILVVFIAVYLLSMALVFFSRSRKWKGGESETAQSEPDTEAASEDSYARTSGELARSFGLTNREKEVLAYLGRGRSSGHIGKALVLSPNTVRAHIRSIYSKLDIHSRQDLIDLFEEDAEAH